MNPKAEELKALQFAMEEDFQQHIINGLTPDRGYPFPMDNVLAWLSRHTPEHEELARDKARLDWLTKSQGCATWDDNDFWSVFTNKGYINETDLRQAIDSAMSQPTK